MNNAGIVDAEDGPPTSGSPEAARRIMDSNFGGTLAVTLNMLTVQFAEELRDTPQVINSVSPGYAKTDVTGHNGFMVAEEGAKLPVEHALLGGDAVSGRFVDASGGTPW